MMATVKPISDGDADPSDMMHDLNRILRMNCRFDTRQYLSKGLHFFFDIRRVAGGDARPPAML